MPARRLSQTSSYTYAEATLTQSADEDLDGGDLSRVRICEREGETRIVYEEFLARFVVLAHAGVESIFVGGKAFAELTVAEAGGLLCAIFFPQKQEGDALSGAFTCDLFPVRQGVLLGCED